MFPGANNFETRLSACRHSTANNTITTWTFKMSSESSTDSEDKDQMVEYWDEDIKFDDNYTHESKQERDASDSDQDHHCPTDVNNASDTSQPPEIYGVFAIEHKVSDLADHIYAKSADNPLVVDEKNLYYGSNLMLQANAMSMGLPVLGVAEEQEQLVNVIEDHNILGDLMDVPMVVSDLADHIYARSADNPLVAKDEKNLYFGSKLMLQANAMRMGLPVLGVAEEQKQPSLVTEDHNLLGEYTNVPYATPAPECAACEREHAHLLHYYGALRPVCDACASFFYRWLMNQCAPYPCNIPESPWNCCTRYSGVIAVCPGCHLKKCLSLGMKR